MRASQITLPAPMRGWVLNENVVAARPDGAQIIENWFPTTRGVRIRRGSRHHATVPDDVVSMMAYRTGAPKMFAATAAGVYDVTAPASVTTPPAAAFNVSAGYFSAQQITTAGGTFMLAVNGADPLWRFDGSDWFPCNADAVRVLDYDGGSAAFEVGETVTGAGGASATIVAIRGDATSGRLWIGPVTGGPFVDGEALTGSVAGDALANGADAAGSSVTITGVDTEKLSHVWMHKSRLWFVEGGTLNAHYLPAGAIGGALSTLDLGAVFTRGGTLLSGERWSVADAGDGMDDRCVFFSTEGEVAVYEGTDPSSASKWALVGVYYVGKLLGRRPFMRAGGDLLVATEEGLVPLSVAIMKDPAALSMAAVSKTIEPHWKVAALGHDAGQWEIVKNTERGFAAVIYPTVNANDRGVLAVNTETGAWARWTWPATCGCEHDGKTWFGTADGKICEMESGGTDCGVAFETKLAFSGTHLGQISAYKHVHMVRGTFIALTPFFARMSLGRDYQASFPAPPSAVLAPANGIWGVSLWGSGVWGAIGAKTVTTRWVSVNRNCQVATIQVQALVSDQVPPEVELASVDVLFDEGGIVV